MSLIDYVVAGEEAFRSMSVSSTQWGYGVVAVSALVLIVMGLRHRKDFHPILWTKAVAKHGFKDGSLKHTFEEIKNEQYVSKSHRRLFEVEVHTTSFERLCAYEKSVATHVVGLSAIKTKAYNALTLRYDAQKKARALLDRIIEKKEPGFKQAHSEKEKEDMEHQKALLALIDVLKKQKEWVGRHREIVKKQLSDIQRIKGTEQELLGEA